MDGQTRVWVVAAAASFGHRLTKARRRCGLLSLTGQTEREMVAAGPRAGECRYQNATHPGGFLGAGRELTKERRRSPLLGTTCRLSGQRCRRLACCCVEGVVPVDWAFEPVGLVWPNAEGVVTIYA